MNTDPNYVKYVCFQEEVGQSGTPHLQGYCEAKSPLRLRRWKEVLGHRAHIFPRKGSAVQAREYCKKPGGKNFFENVPFVPPQQGRRTDLLGVYDMIRAGKDLVEICHHDPGSYIKYHGGIDKVSLMLTRRSLPPYLKRDVFVFFGPSGVGKTRRAYRYAGERGLGLYTPLPCALYGFWFDGYTGEQVILLDDFRGAKSACTFDNLLRFTDGYPYLGNVKGAVIPLKHTTVIITAPNHPQDWYPEETDANLSQLRRRISLLSYMAVPYVEQEDYRAACLEYDEKTVLREERWRSSIPEVQAIPPPRQPLTCNNFFKPLAESKKPAPPPASQTAAARSYGVDYDPGLPPSFPPVTAGGSTVSSSSSSACSSTPSPLGPPQFQCPPAPKKKKKRRRVRSPHRLVFPPPPADLPPPSSESKSSSGFTLPHDLPPPSANQLGEEDIIDLPLTDTDVLSEVSTSDEDRRIGWHTKKQRVRAPKPKKKDP